MEAVSDLINKINDVIINPILALVFAVALFLFLLGAFKLVWGAPDDGTRSEGKQHMLWGLIGMTIMISTYLILEIGLRTFSIQRKDIPADLPLNL